MDELDGLVIENLVDSLRSVYGEKADCYHCHSTAGCYGSACMEHLCHVAADAIEKQTATAEQWKQAWKTANTLYEQMKDENVRLKKELDRQMSICGR